MVNLEDAGKKKVKDFSLGMKRRLGIAVALCSNPDFLILDEPINGIDPEGIVEIKELILKLNKNWSITIMVSNHYLDELSKVATQYAFIDKGNIIKQLSARELAKTVQSRTEMKVSNVESAVIYCENHSLSYEVMEKILCTNTAM